MKSLKALEEYLKSKDNAENFISSSEIPSICKSEPCMLGVDEAGRGPVLGPMVYGVAYCPVRQKAILQSLGCADSKALTEDKRDEIFSKMLTEDEPLQNVGWNAEIISPKYISNSMYRRAKHSLNEVSMNSAISLIKKAIEDGVNLAEIYVDTVGPPEKYQAKLIEIFPGIKITGSKGFFVDITNGNLYVINNISTMIKVAKKADSIYPIVSTASIVAKVTRDRALRVWNFKEGSVQDNFGSGYPGDPLTKKFIRDQVDSVFGYPLLVRFSWSTAEHMLQEKAATCTFEEIDEVSPNKKAAGTKSISTFFSPKEEKRSRKRHKFFEERYLTFINAFE